MCKVVFGIGISVSLAMEEYENQNHGEASLGSNGTQENPIVLDEDPQPSGTTQDKEREIIVEVKGSAEENAQSPLV